MPGEREIGAEPRLSKPEPSNGASDGAGASVGGLLAEVNALALRLRQLARDVRRADTVPSCGQSVLDILSRHGAQTVPQIAQVHGTSRQNIQHVVNRLQSQGSVQLSGNPAHRRSALVTLTGRGRESLAAATSGEQQFSSALASGLSEAEIQAATELLRRLRQLLARPETAVPSELMGVKSATAKGVGQPTERLNAGPAWEPQPNENELPFNLL